METGKKSEETALNSSKTTTKTKDTEAQTPSKTKHRRRNLCLAVTAAVIILFIVIIVIVAFTVLKPKQPTMKIDSISLENLKVGLDIAKMGVNLNMTLAVDLTVKNSNKVGMKYKNSSALMNYRGELVGVVPIPAGKIRSGETKPMNVSVTMMADRLLSNPQIFSDVVAGMLNMSTVVKLSGKVPIFNVFKIGVETTTTCDVSVSITDASIAEQKCKYKTKI